MIAVVLQGAMPQVALGTETGVLIIGIGVPVEIKSNAVVLGWGFRASYGMPANLSELMPMDANTRRRRSVSRWDIYKTLERMSEMKGHGGRSCILRAICEAADVPIEKYNGLFEEMFHTIFTPTTTNEDIQHHTDNEYYAAQIFGTRNKGSCRQLFPECKATLMDLFTTVHKNNVL
ncbi:hypothetical protein NQ317_016752 [Molorchus minor]|uniref:Uncharacterized protein n=1 Tax=Molorchus minor TaxID=1323400 RepID=A0ABQ9JNH7_9CUCU|nr:hypothetical protein NQ317_016752 [Molorchus minor]